MSISLDNSVFSLKASEYYDSETVLDYPTIFSEDYWKSQVSDWEANWDNLTVTSGSDKKGWLGDGDPDTKWESSGSDDGTTEELDIDFYDPYNAVSREFDTIIILNHNWKLFEVYSNEGGTLIGKYSESDSYTFISLDSAVTSGDLRIEILTTQTADQEKYAGEIIVCKERLTLPDFDIYEPSIFEGGGRFRLKSGTAKKYTEFEKRRISFGFEFLPENTLETLEDIWKENSSFVIYPEPEDRPLFCFEAQFMDPLSFPYSVFWKGAGFDFRIEIEQV